MERIRTLMLHVFKIKSLSVIWIFFIHRYSYYLLLGMVYGLSQKHAHILIEHIDRHIQFARWLLPAMVLCWWWWWWCVCVVVVVVFAFFLIYFFLNLYIKEFGCLYVCVCISLWIFTTQIATNPPCSSSSILIPVPHRWWYARWMDYDSHN